MRIRPTILVVFIVLGSNAPAHAHSHAGAVVKLMPLGTGTASSDSTSVSTDLAVAFAIQGFFDYALTPNLYVGVAPQLILNVKGKDDSSSGQELDLFARIMGRYPVADKVQLYGYLAPGFSIIFPPDLPGVSNPTGFVLGFAGGVSYSITPTLFGSGEVGYQIGFQSTGGSDLKTRYLHIGFVIGAMF